MEAFGAPQAAIDAARAKIKPAAPDMFGVWPENWDTVAFFESVETQWIFVSGLGGAERVGLDYCRVESTMNMSGILRKNRPKLLKEIQLMERAALDVWNKQAKSRSEKR